MREYARLESNKGEDGLAGELIIDTDNGSLCDTLVEDQSRLDLSSGETVSRDVDDIWLPIQPIFSGASTERHTVKTTLDPNVSVFITGGTVTSIEKSRVWLSRTESETTLHMMRKKYEPSCKHRGNGCDPD